MEVCVDGNFFAFTGGSGLVTWPELTPFLSLKIKLGNLAFGGGRRLWWEWTVENHMVWRNFSLNKKISNSWLRAWWSSIRYHLSIAESSSRNEIFLIADLRKFYRVSNSIAESPIRKEILIIAERRKFFQVFYCKIAMPWTQKILNAEHEAVGVFPSRLFIKELSKKQIVEIHLNTFFLNYNCCCCYSTEDSTVWRLPFLKDFLKSVLVLNSNEFYYFLVSVPLLCSLFSA